ncbi:MAG: NADH-quinone oxidoreductase subunit L, partial [Bacteroidia bacterium]|nr:NADH-quinone oxidoreductase subunit L [Bacteroidia bacterium]
NLFIFFMLMLVLGNNFLVMFIGWEGVGFCSFMLIGFWYKENKNNDAAKKAFVMNRIGDLGFLIAMFLIYVNFGTLNFTTLFAPGFIAASAVSTGTITWITFCLFVGAMGKSAQLPLFTWLPDAMAGPTPVSALIHAATMVTAGIYMVARTNIMFSLSPDTLKFVAIIGIATSLIGAFIGLFQNDIKKVLAYSTVSQLGLMFLALGMGAYTAAVFHVVTHAFFKALLFLGSGSVIHAMGGDQDIRNMGGLRKKLPITYITFLIGTIAISGIPPFAGFFSKDEMLAEVFSQSKTLFALGLIVSLLTAFYMFRLLFLTFHGKFRGTHDQEHHLHESPASMTIPLVILATLAAFAGFMGFPHALGEELGIHNWIGHFLDPVLGGSINHFSASTEVSLMVFATLTILIVVAATWFIYIKNKTIPAEENQKLPFLKNLIYHKFYIDELYYNLFTRPLGWISSFLAKTIDHRMVDNLVNGVGKATSSAGQTLRLIQTGNISTYIIAIVAATILMFLIFIF